MSFSRKLLLVFLGCLILGSTYQVALGQGEVDSFPDEAMEVWNPETGQYELVSAQGDATGQDENGGVDFLPEEPEEEWNPETGQFELPKVLGDAMADLVYTPITPCRLVDTRPAATPSGSFVGPIAGGTTLDIDTDGNGALGAQGGNAAGCGSYDNVVAVVVTITAAAASGNGHFQAFAHGDPLPNASALNYKTGNTLANTTIVPQDTSTHSKEMSLYTSATTHVIVDIVGYFEPPEATALDTIRLAKTQSIGSFATVQFDSPTCSTGYVRTGGNCNPGSSYNLIEGPSHLSSVSPGFMHCVFKNTSFFATTAYANVICARVPGK